MGEVGDLLHNTRDSIETGLASLSSLLKKLDSGKGIFGGLLTSDTAKDQFLETVKNLKNLTTDLKSGKGILGSLFMEGSDQQVKFDRILTQMDSGLASIQAGEGALGLLLKDEKTRTNLDDSIRTFSESIEAIANSPGTSPPTSSPRAI